MDNPEIDKYKVFVPESEVNCPNDKYPCSWFVATAHHAINATNTMKYKRRRRRSLSDDVNQVHHMFISTPGCRVFNSETSKWEGNGCSVDHRSTPEHTECFCKNLPKSATFSTQFFVPPNKIQMQKTTSIISTELCYFFALKCYFLHIYCKSGFKNRSQHA